MISEKTESELLGLLRATARAEILPRYRALGHDDIASKTSASDLVTIADQGAEKMISAGIAKILPDAEIVGEEAVSENPNVLKRIGDSKLSVIIDPIDGTWNFAKGLPLFGVILAVVHRSETVFGALYDPVMDDATTARKGQGAFHVSRDGSRKQLHLSKPERKGLADMIGAVPHCLYSPEERQRIATRFMAFERVLSYRCACHEYRILAEGSLDFSMSGPLKPWDHAAGELIYREAGGFAAMVDTMTPYRPDMTEGRLLLARSREAWREIHEALF